MQEIVNSVEKVSTLTKEISTASAEQSDGVSSVNGSIQQMDAITQQNAATAEETASASEELSAQSHTLLELVGSLALQVLDSKKAGNGDTTGYAGAKKTGGSKVSVSRHDKDKDDNNGVSQEIDEERLIPMGDNRIKEHSGHFSDF